MLLHDAMENDRSGIEKIWSSLKFWNDLYLKMQILSNFLDLNVFYDFAKYQMNIKWKI